MLFSALVMLMGAGWYGLHSQGQTLQVRETVAAASETAEFAATLDGQIDRPGH